MPVGIPNLEELGRNLSGLYAEPYERHMRTHASHFRICPTFYISQLGNSPLAAERLSQRIYMEILEIDGLRVVTKFLMEEFQSIKFNQVTGYKT